MLLNYFWLSDDPEECASWYCDQHCFKIGSEVIESIWDPISVLAPDLFELATEQGISMAYRRRRHAPKDKLWHPLSIWHGLCMSNMKRGLINAKAIFVEHAKRTGCVHSASKDCDFLLKHITRVNFQTSIWKQWFSTQNGSSATHKNREERLKWCAVHAIAEQGKSINIVDRNKCEMTPHPILTFDECKIDGDLIASYRNYYHAKVHTIKNGMRYYHTIPPSWLCSAANMAKIKTRKLFDEDGYVIVIFVDG